MSKISTKLEDSLRGYRWHDRGVPTVHNLYMGVWTVVITIDIAIIDELNEIK